MPRKKARQAQDDLERQHSIRLAYLIRNGKFRHDIQAIVKQRASMPGSDDDLTPERVRAMDPIVKSLQELEKKWGLPFGVLSQLSWPEWCPEGPPHRSYSSADFRFGSPVVALTTLPSGLLTLPLPKPTDTRYLNLRVDLDYPVETLLSAIEQKLRQYARMHSRGRKRLDKGDLQLQVFDQAEEGKTFKAIAKEVQKSVSTVKSVYLAAIRNIFGPGVRPDKKALPLLDFVPSGHCDTCPTCKKAQRPEELCNKARLHANQGQKGQWELVGYDTVQQ